MKKICLVLIVLFWGSLYSSAQNESANEKYYQISKNIEIYSNVLNELNNLYVDPIEPGKMLKDALDGMLIQLDPFTNYISEYDVLTAGVMQKNAAAAFGFHLRKNSQGEIVIGQILENSPAAIAGLQIGQQILKINGKSIEGYGVDDLNIIIKAVSSNGLNIECALLNNSSTKVYDLKTTDAKAPSAVTYASLIGQNKNIAFVSLAQFLPNCSQQIKAKLDSLKNATNDKKLQGVILDFRDNPGGLLDEAVKICGLFLPKGKLVVTTKGKTAEWNQNFITANEPWDTSIAVGVLLNATSASASEVVAGTLQDYDRAVIVGEQSYGKGLVQIYKDIGYKAKLKLTTAKYYTPSGRCIQAIDYSNRTIDGKALRIADTAKKAFKTTNGRTVYDGAGIMPDINQIEQASNYIKSVINNGLVFDYATIYVQKNKDVPNIAQFQLTEALLNDFFNWVLLQPVSGNNLLENSLNALKNTIAIDGNKPEINSVYKQFEQTLKKERKLELDQYKLYFNQLLSEEIISRYHNKNGAIAYTINNTASNLSKLLQVMEDKVKYQNILKN